MNCQVAIVHLVSNNYKSHAETTCRSEWSPHLLSVDDRTNARDNSRIHSFARKGCLYIVSCRLCKSYLRISNECDLWWRMLQRPVPCDVSSRKSPGVSTILYHFAKLATQRRVFVHQTVGCQQEKFGPWQYLSVAFWSCNWRTRYTNRLTRSCPNTR